MNRAALLLCLLPLTVACASSTPPQQQAEFKGDPMTPNEKHHIVEPCEEHALAPGRVLLEVAIDEQGKARDARVTELGGTVRQAFINCAQTRLLAEKYEPRGKATTIAAVVDLRVGSYMSAGSAQPIPPGY
jgi:hypothetical protein